MAAEFDWLTRAMPNLTPEELAAILSGQVSADTGGNMPMRSAGGFTQQGTYRSTNSGDAEYIDRTPGGAVWDNSVINGPNLNDTNYFAQYDPQGRFLGYAEGTDDSSWKDFLTAAAIILGGYYGGTYLSEAGAASGAGGAAGAGGGAGGASAADWAGWAAGEQSGALAGSGYAGADFMAGEAAAAGTAGASQAGTSGLSEFRQGEIGSYQTDGSLPTSPATTTQTGGVDLSKTPTTTPTSNSGGGTNQQVPTNADGSVDWAKLISGGGDWGNIVGGLLGAYAGYQSGKDKQNTTRTEPWGPAQPYLQGLLQKGAGLYDRFEATPFSDAERAAYANQGNALDYINANAPGLMSGFDATAAGRNQFVRGQPRGLIGNSYDAATSPVAWRPSLLGDFGTTTAAVRRR